jgi:predicted ester cyclase
VTVEDMIAEGDTVAFRLTLRGTHEGEFIGVPATGNRIEMTVQNFYRLRDGKVVERWSNPDMLTLMVQLGAVPAPGAAA